MAVLWLGLALCVGVLLRAAGEVSGTMQAIGWRPAVAILACMTLVATGALQAWRIVVVAVADVRLTMHRAYRQMALLLLGKYVPGGVVGFLARLQDGRGEAGTLRLAAAGLVEQCLGLAAVAACGALLYSCGLCDAPRLLILLVLLPLLVLVASRAGLVIVASLPSARLKAAVAETERAQLRMRSLLLASALLLVSNLAWGVIAALMAIEVAGVGVMGAVGIAGAYALGIAGGMVAIVVPGGIGVREAITVSLASAFIDPETALVIAAMLRLLAVAFDVLVGVTAIGGPLLLSFFGFFRRSS